MGQVRPQWSSNTSALMSPVQTGTLTTTSLLLFFLSLHFYRVQIKTLLFFFSVAFRGPHSSCHHLPLSSASST